MKTITVSGPGPMTVASGQIQLDARQASARMHALKTIKANKQGAGLYEVLGPVQFKVGESFGYDGEVGKDGLLRDREAEELARMEAVDKASAVARKEGFAAGELEGRAVAQAEADSKLVAAAAAVQQAVALVESAIALVPESERAGIRQQLDALVAGQA